jgi:hypothetical protein
MVLIIAKNAFWLSLALKTTATENFDASALVSTDGDGGDTGQFAKREICGIERWRNTPTV